MDKINKTSDIKNYMKAYRASTNKVCDMCGGKFNQYTEQKHKQSAKHLKQVAKQPVVFDKDINKEEIEKWLEERFLTTAKEASSPHNKTKRVNSNLTLWKKLAGVAESLKYQWLLKNRLELVKLAYKTPSSQQVALSALKIVLDHVHPLGDLKQEFYKEGQALSKKYIEEATVNDNTMSYADLKKLENDEDPIIAMFAHLYNPEMPPLRLSEWVNAYVGKNKQLNEIILSKKIMRRRISKNMSEEVDIPLSNALVKFLKKIEVKGPLFGNMDLQEIVNIINRKLGPGNGPRAFRINYSTEIAPKLSGKERVELATQLDHSVRTSVLIYQRDKPAEENIVMEVKPKSIYRVGY